MSLTPSSQPFNPQQSAGSSLSKGLVIGLLAGAAILILLMGIWIGGRGDDSGVTAQEVAPAPAAPVQEAPAVEDTETEEAPAVEEPTATLAPTTTEAPPTTLASVELRRSMAHNENDYCGAREYESGFSMNTVAYDTGVVIDLPNGIAFCDHAVEVRLDRKYSTFVGVIGFTDDGNTDEPIKVTITTETGEVLLDRTFALGQTQDLDLEVGSYLRLIIRADYVDYNGLSTGSAIGVAGTFNP